MKGDQCIYDHGPDPVVVDDIALEKMVTNGAKPAVAQIATNFSVPPPGYTPLNPPPPGVDNVYATNSGVVVSGTISEGLFPRFSFLFYHKSFKETGIFIYRKIEFRNCILQDIILKLQH